MSKMYIVNAASHNLGRDVTECLVFYCGSRNKDGPLAVRPTTSDHMTG